MIYIPQIGQVAGAVYATLKSMLGAELVSKNENSVRYRYNDLLVVAADDCEIDRLEHWQRIARARKVRLLLTQVHGGEAVIGLEIAPDRPGCVQCWLRRYYNGRSQGLYFAQAFSERDGPLTEDPWLTPAAASIIGQLAAETIIAALNPYRYDANNPYAKVYYLDLKTFNGRECRIAPDYLCPCCGQLPFDSAESVRLRVSSQPKPYPEADRLRDVREFAKAVQELYVGRRAGIVSEVNTAFRFRHGAVAIADLPLFDPDKPEPCSGFSDRYSVARTTAVFEAIERYSGLQPRSRRPAIRSNVSSLGSLVIDPKLFGLYSQSEYNANADLLTPYRDDLEMEFIWAYSCQRQEPVLIPRQLGFYSYAGQSDQRFVVEGSNGCSLGSCPEEAILHGILEVVERDAFLLTWYARRRRPRLDLADCTDAEIRSRNRLMQREGYDVYAFDITTEYGIPAVWLMALCRDSKMPYAACIGAAHLHSERAIRKGLRELSAVLNRCVLEMGKTEMRRRALLVAEEPDQVVKTIDHALFYCVPQSARHLEFLFECEETTTLGDMDARSRELWSEDLGDELRRTINRILSTGSDIIVVNQTAPEQLPLGLCTYKALIPGALPMTCGQSLRRLEGLHRLNSALGENFLPSPNPAPHPFT